MLTDSAYQVIYSCSGIWGSCCTPAVLYYLLPLAVLQVSLSTGIPNNVYSVHRQWPWKIWASLGLSLPLVEFHVPQPPCSTTAPLSHPVVGPHSSLVCQWACAGLQRGERERSLSPFPPSPIFCSAFHQTSQCNSHSLCFLPPSLFPAAKPNPVFNLAALNLFKSTKHNLEYVEHRLYPYWAVLLTIPVFYL